MEDYIKINQSIVTRYYRHLLLKKTENYERKSLLIKNLKKYIPHTLAGIAVITLLYKTNKEFAELLK